jgi:S1-C subfamily serine protease
MRSSVDSGAVVTGSVLDLVLIVVAIAFAANGYRQGLVVGFLGFLGFLGGALLGVQVSPLVAERVDAGVGRVLVALLVVFAIASLGQALAVVVGSALRRRLPGKRTRTADNLGGAVVSVLAALLVVWMVAAPLASAPVPWLASQVRRSAVIAGVDNAMPDSVRRLYASLGAAVDQGDFPEVFGRLTPTKVTPVEAPDPRLASSAVVRSAGRSVVKVLGEAPSCNRRLEGTGFVFAPQRVMTNAHVVAGTQRLVIEVGGDRYDARVVVYDPARDLAVLAVPGLSAPILRFTGPARPGSDAIVVGYPLDGPYTAVSARVRDIRQVRGPDIYNDATVDREVYTIRATVRSGNSGGPLLAADGSVYGVIFAAAVDDPQTGFALTARESAPVVAAGRAASAAVDTGACD